MNAFPNPADLVQGTGLPASSPLQKVLVAELERLKTLAPTPSTRRASAKRPFEEALRRDRAGHGGAIIAEYKQGSPSLGPFALGTPLTKQLEAYRDGGASCLSILAEPAYFHGGAAHLAEGAKLGLPCLYKGFVISEAHLQEAAASGASAVLLIARVLKEHTAAFAQAARNLGLEPLLELHDLTEIPFIQAAEAGLVGVNARDLSAFTLARPTAEPLREAFPQAVLIRESGLATPDDAVAALTSGFDAVLIGEALMRSKDSRLFLSRVRAGLAEKVAP